MRNRPPSPGGRTATLAVLTVVVAALLVGAGVLVLLDGSRSGSDPTRVAAGASGRASTDPTSSSRREPATTSTTPPSTTTTTAAPSGPPVVLVIGDSLTVQATPTLVEQAEGLDLRIRAEVRTTVADWLPRVPALLAEARPDVVVVALGTNDNWPTNRGEAPPVDLPAERAAYRQRVRALLAELRPIPCVVWVEPAEVAPVSEYLLHAADHGAILRDELERAGAHGVDWTGVLNDGKAFDRDWMQADAIHLRAAGRFAFAAVTLDAVRSSC